MFDQFNLDQTDGVSIRIEIGAIEDDFGLGTFSGNSWPICEV